MTSSETWKQSVAASPRTLELRIGDARDALDRFEAAWNRRTEGRSPLHVLSLADLPLLLRTLTPARWELLDRLREAGPLSIYELAKRLERDYKNVHTDVARLTEIGLIEKQADARVAVRWDVVRAEF
jgi:predicted transcriptional regulator